ncbi:vitamin K-dependent protein Z isoform X2 [Manis javanica]|uniref:vitamin K-dependent protein Z isoform X2 n=1 Tax=Manis javanica TaxID=9974 RepID=UPI003C6D6C5A
MAPCVRLLFILLLFLEPHRAASSVFVPASDANEVLDGFWERYMGGSPCASRPCLNNGSCQDSVRSYTCSCPSGYEGRDCALAKNECHASRTDGCQHFCRPGKESYACSCAQGYRLGPDRKACVPHERCACGAPSPEGITAPLGGRRPLQAFPWQTRSWHQVPPHFTPQVQQICAEMPSALKGETNKFRRKRLLRWCYNTEKFCTDNSKMFTITQKYQCENKREQLWRGDNSPESQRPRVQLLLGPSLTPAACAPFLVCTPGSRRASADPLAIGVKGVHVHMRYEEETGDNDISLLELGRPIQCPDAGLPICVPEKDFAEHVLIPGTGGLLSGWTLHGPELGDVTTQLLVTLMDSEECGRALNATVTTRMYCDRGVAGGSLQWAGGSTVAREHAGTWFLTGILGAVPREEHAGAFLLTKVARYSLWFRQVMSNRAQPAE